MSTRSTSKPKTPDNVKRTAATKIGADQEKIINELRQAIIKLTNELAEVRRKLNEHKIIVDIPEQTFSKVNDYLVNVVNRYGFSLSLSRFVCEAVELYLDAEEENWKIEEERRLSEIEELAKRNG